MVVNHQNVITTFKYSKFMSYSPSGYKREEVKNYLVLFEI